MGVNDAAVRAVEDYLAMYTDWTSTRCDITATEIIALLAGRDDLVPSAEVAKLANFLAESSEGAHDETESTVDVAIRLLSEHVGAGLSEDTNK